MDRNATAEALCADYSNDTLMVMVDQFFVDVYGLLIVRRIDTSEHVVFEGRSRYFELSNSSFSKGNLYANGTEFQIISGLVVFEQFPELVGKDILHSFPHQEQVNVSVYEIQLDRDYLKTMLNENECYLFISYGPQTISPKLKINEGIPDGYAFRTISDRIIWEYDDVTLFNSLYKEQGACWHKLSKQPSNITDISKPMVAAMVLILVVLFFLVLFLFKRHRRGKKQQTAA